MRQYDSLPCLLMRFDVRIFCVCGRMQASPGYRLRERRCTRLLQSDLYCELASVKPVLMRVNGDTTLPESGTQCPQMNGWSRTLSSENIYFEIYYIIL